MNASDLLICVVLTRRFEFYIQGKAEYKSLDGPPVAVGALIDVAVIACQIAAAVDLQNELQGGQTARRIMSEYPVASMFASKSRGGS
jgi:hypothetical protein